MFTALGSNPERSFTISLLTNDTVDSAQVKLATIMPGRQNSVYRSLGLAWPDELYSLTHVALPFPPDDALYGGLSPQKSPGIHLGDIALRGERGVLQISSSEMLRLRWNPFYSFLEDSVLDFFKLTDPGSEAVAGGEL